MVVRSLRCPFANRHTVLSRCQHGGPASVCQLMNSRPPFGPGTANRSAELECGDGGQAVNMTGRSRIVMTRTRYSHITEGMQQKAVERAAPVMR